MTTSACYTDSCRSAKEFMEHLRPSAPHWETHITGKLRWVFRGQSDARWRLLPSAWRTADSIRDEISSLGSPSHESLVDFDYALDRCRLYIPGPVADVNEQTEVELRILQEFIAHANLATISFPYSSVDLKASDFGFVAHAEDIDKICCYGFEHRKSPFFDAVLATLRQDISDILSSHEVDDSDTQFQEFILLGKRWPYLTNFTMRHSVAALAQHHGIPTRILDWTHDARKAAFFACNDLDKTDMSAPDKEIAVFGLNPFMLKNRWIAETELVENINDKDAVALFLSQHSLFAAKTDTTSYIAAQEGLFTFAEYADLHRVFTGEYPTLDMSLEQMANWRIRRGDQNVPSIRDYIRKITLPYSEVDELMELLDDERIMLTTLMPNLDRLKECMLTRCRRKQRLRSQQQRTRP